MLELYFFFALGQTETCCAESFCFSIHALEGGYFYKTDNNKECFHLFCFSLNNEIQKVADIFYLFSVYL